MERETGKNYVFDLVIKEKKKGSNSASNISSVNFGSPQPKMSAPAKIMMN